MVGISNKRYQRDFPLIIGTVAAVIVIANFFISGAPAIDLSRAEILKWSTIAAAFALLVGALATTLLHVNRITSKTGDLKPGTRALSGLTIATMVIFILVGISSPRLTASAQYVSLYTHISASLQQGVRGVAFFSCLIGAYHALRADSIDSLMLFLGTAIYLLRSIAIGLFLLPIIQPIGNWVISVPAVGAGRAGILVVAIGALILSVRVFAGKEKAVDEMMEP